jgi:hypothetical protein
MLQPGRKVLSLTERNTLWVLIFFHILTVVPKDYLINLHESRFKALDWDCLFLETLLKGMVVKYGLKIITEFLLVKNELLFTLGYL